MLTLESLLAFIPTIVILVILPGSDFAIVTKISLFDGKKPAQAAAVGITLGMCLHTTLAPCWGFLPSLQVQLYFFLQ